MGTYYPPIPPQRAIRSAGVTAAAIVAIAASVLTVLSNLVTCVVIFFVAAIPSAPPLEGPERMALVAVYAFFIGLGGFGIATGVGLLRLRNWARISALVWAGMLVLFGLFGILITAAMPQDPNMPPEAHLMAVLMMGVLSLGAVGIGVWWLVLFTRRGVRMQFTQAQYMGVPNPYLHPYTYPAMQPAAMQFPAMPPGAMQSPGPQVPGAAPSPMYPVRTSPRAPVPIIIIACFMLMAIPGLLMMPFLPVPLLMFGHLLRGALARSLAALLGIAQAVCGVGLLKLQSWTYWLALVVQGFIVVNGITTALDPHLADHFKEIMAAMPGLNMPEAPGMDPALFLSVMQPLMRFSMIGGCLITILMLGLLIYYGKPFREAAREAAAKA